MLAYLRVRNLAILRDVEITFGGGLNVLTGETGAGKSILVVAVSLLLGDRADASRVRRDAEAATIEGQFLPVSPGLVRVLARVGIAPCDEEGLVVRRELRRHGPNRIFINGTLAPLAVLRRVMARQVALHGQNSHLTLASREEQGRFFDGFLGDRLDLEEIARAWAELRAAAEEWEMHEHTSVGVEGPATFIFDEVDAGIGGEQAAILARRLRRVAEAHQVICVTHLPQVAAAAACHLRIVKAVRGGQVRTSVAVLGEEERVDELARMLGEGATPGTAQRHALALVEAARQDRPRKRRRGSAVRREQMAPPPAP